MDGKSPDQSEIRGSKPVKPSATPKGFRGAHDNPPPPTIWSTASEPRPAPPEFGQPLRTTLKSIPGQTPESLGLEKDPQSSPGSEAKEA